MSLMLRLRVKLWPIHRLKLSLRKTISLLQAMNAAINAATNAAINAATNAAIDAAIDAEAYQTEQTGCESSHH